MSIVLKDLQTRIYQCFVESMTKKGVCKFKNDLKLSDINSHLLREALTTEDVVSSATLSAKLNTMRKNGLITYVEDDSVSKSRKLWTLTSKGEIHAPFDIQREIVYAKFLVKQDTA